MITLLIIGVILAYGVPNFAEFTQNSRMTSTANDLHASFLMARSEAARAKTNIGICASADQATCGGTWDQGYIVYVENNNPPDLIVGNAADETILRSHGPVAEGVMLRVANNANYFMFASTGLGAPNVGGNPAVTQVIMCDDRGNITAAGGNSAARLFVATPLGRATILRDKTLIGNALANMGVGCP